MVEMQKAKPVWPQGRRLVKNDFVLFRAEFVTSAEKPVILLVTGCTLYRIKCNGSFLAAGPARGAKGHFRVDELVLPVHPGHNTVDIEVSGSNCNSYYYMNQPSFLQAEIFDGEDVVCWTGNNFRACDLTGERLPKVSRMGCQRMFTEVYSVSPRRSSLTELPLAECPPVNLLPRRVAQPEYLLDESYWPCRKLRRRYDPALPVKKINYAIKEWKGGYTMYEPEELEFDSESKMQFYAVDSNGSIESTVYEGKINNSGFIRAKVNCTHPGLFVLFFDEVVDTNGSVDPTRPMTVNAIFWKLQEPGLYDLEAMEANTCKYIECFMDGGEAEVLDVSMREYKSPLFKKSCLDSTDADLQAIYQAGCETLAANSVDCLTDCPSRERAAWLCDSFFSSRTAFLLTGNTSLEHFFLENFALAAKFDYLPEGAIPMLYPGDHPGGVYIPNWAMWLILQTEEYLQRSGDRAMIDALRDRFFGFIDYLDSFLNSDGLLENLPSWVFIEWSQANSFVQNVSYPSNMTYAAVLDAVARLYNRENLALRAKKMRETIRSQSWNGMWFRDHAIRNDDGSLEIPESDITETCQYYAFFFGTATAKTYPELWKRLICEFGPQRQKLGLWKEIWPSNTFIGNYLRLELLSQAGLHQQLLGETKEFFKKMADTTGTLWEHDRTKASCCHGFASYINVLLDRAVHAPSYP